MTDPSQRGNYIPLVDKRSKEYKDFAMERTTAFFLSVLKVVVESMNKHCTKEQTERKMMIQGKEYFEETFDKVIDFLERMKT